MMSKLDEARRCETCIARAKEGTSGKVESKPWLSSYYLDTQASGLSDLKGRQLLASLEVCCSQVKMGSHAASKEMKASAVDFFVDFATTEAALLERVNPSTRTWVHNMVGNAMLHLLPSQHCFGGGTSQLKFGAIQFLTGSRLKKKRAVQHPPGTFMWFYDYSGIFWPLAFVSVCYVVQENVVYGKSIMPDDDALPIALSTACACMFQLWHLRASY